MSENDKQPHDVNPVTGLLKAIVAATEELHPILRVFILGFVLIVVVSLLGVIVPDNLVPLLYVLAILCVVGYLALEIIAKLGERTQPTEAGEATGNRSTDAVGQRETEVESPVQNATKSPPEPAVATTPEEMHQLYCRQLVRICNRLTLATIDIKAATRPEAAELELSEVFTSLDVEGGELRAIKNMVREDEAHTNRISAVAALAKWDKIVLLGDPGSGKSTFVNFLTLCQAGEQLHDPVVNLKRLGDDWKLPAMFPLRIVLREYAAEGLLNKLGIWQFIVDRLKGRQPGAPDLSAFADRLRGTLKSEPGGLLILDGLDEVPEAHRTREQLKDAVLTFCDEFPLCRVLVTARPYAYQDERWRLPGFAVKRLADFSPEQIQSFIESWYVHIAAKDSSLSEEDARRYTAQLQTATKENPRLAELAPRPLLLTLMASLHRWRGGGALPEKRQELYEASVVLLLDLWQRPKRRFDGAGQPVQAEHDVFRELGITQERLREALQHVAYEVHRDQPVLQGVADIPVDKLAGAIFQAAEVENIRRVTRYVTDRAGLLIERQQGQQYAFPHRTFQEYMAACHLADDEFPYKLYDRVREDDERWREVALLAASKAASGSKSTIWTLLSTFCDTDWSDGRTPEEADWYGVLRAAQALMENEQHVDVPARQQHLVERLTRWTERLCSLGALPPPDRALAGRLLATLGDPRPGVGLRSDNSKLPDVLWCDVPAGTLTMGAAPDDEEASESERGPDGKPFPVEVQAFRLSAYPVTYSQFRPFVDGDGYQNSDYWTKDGWSFVKEYNRTKSYLWDDEKWHVANHPVVGVTWFEAVAWCRWMTQRLRERGELGAEQEIRLPSEAEWEWAARGPDANKYVWGSKWSEGMSNSAESAINHTCAVGIFPQDAPSWLASDAAGVYDLAGNVWEWCATKWHKYDTPADINAEGKGERVFRGGLWATGKECVRCSSRDRYHPDNRHSHIGFRCAQ